jgi:signal transduction histidine kinase
MIRRILDVNAIEQDGQKLEMQKLDVIPILQEAVNDFRRLAERKEIEIITELPEEPAVLNVDPAAFRQVIDNLLSNAVKFSPGGTTVTAGVDASAERTRSAFSTYVREQGPGIAPEDMPKLFQRYARLSAQPTGGEASTGLGLAIVKKYVEAMGGRVWFKNNEGEGTTFWVEF